MRLILAAAAGTIMAFTMAFAISAMSSTDEQSQLHGLVAVDNMASTPQDACQLLELQPQIRTCVARLLYSTNTAVQQEAVRAVCYLLGDDSDSPVNQTLIGSTAGVLGGLLAALASSHEDMHADPGSSGAIQPGTQASRIPSTHRGSSRGYSAVAWTAAKTALLFSGQCWWR